MLAAATPDEPEGHRSPPPAVRPPVLAPAREASGRASPHNDQLQTEFDPDSILFQGEGLLAIDKPAGVPVHRGTGHAEGIAELATQWARLNPGAIELRQGRSIHPVNRLDREASGVLLLGLTPAMRARAQAAFAGRTVRKLYLAVVSGPVRERGRIRGKVRSRLRGENRMLDAGIEYRRIWGDDRLSLVAVEPREGRTHQIRALFASRGRPLAGDGRYGKPKPARQFLEKFGVPGLLLHCLELALPAGVLGAARVFRAPLPGTFLEVIRAKGWPEEEVLRRIAARR